MEEICQHPGDKSQWISLPGDKLICDKNWKRPLGGRNLPYSKRNCDRVASLDGTLSSSYNLVNVSRCKGTGVERESSCLALSSRRYPGSLF